MFTSHPLHLSNQDFLCCNYNRWVLSKSTYNLLWPVINGLQCLAFPTIYEPYALAKAIKPRPHTFWQDRIWTGFSLTLNCSHGLILAWILVVEVLGLRWSADMCKRQWQMYRCFINIKINLMLYDCQVIMYMVERIESKTYCKTW